MGITWKSPVTILPLLYKQILLTFQFNLQHTGRQYYNAADPSMAGKPHPWLCGHHQQRGKRQYVFALPVIQLMETGRGRLHQKIHIKPCFLITGYIMCFPVTFLYIKPDKKIYNAHFLNFFLFKKLFWV